MPALCGTATHSTRPGPLAALRLPQFTCVVDARPPAVPADLLFHYVCAGTADQVREVTEGLQRLDYYLTNITNEQVGLGGAAMSLLAS